MNIYAIADLHLSSDGSKSMEKFGWTDHENKIWQDWNNKVQDDDIVIIAGDISWALKLDDALKDLEKIANQKGKKILIKGNHDFWWTSIKKLENFNENIFFIQNNIYETNDYVFCGTRGWTCPNSEHFSEQDKKLYEREVIRLQTAISLAKSTQKEIILILHYPPTNEKKERSKFVDLIEENNIKTVIYGHLHGSQSFDLSYKEIVNNVHYHLVSCDYLNFKLKKIF